MSNLFAINLDPLGRWSSDERAFCVCLHMPRERVGSCKGSLTDGANVRLLAAMCFLVLAETARLRKAAMADGALERLVARVDAHVIDQAPAFRKSLAATRMLASKRFFAIVSPHMQLQASRFPESCTALLALIRTPVRMGLQVSLKLLSLLEYSLCTLTYASTAAPLAKVLGLASAGVLLVMMLVQFVDRLKSAGAIAPTALHRAFTFIFVEKQGSSSSVSRSEWCTIETCIETHHIRHRSATI